MVSSTACSSLCTVSVALSTAAFADARLASRVAVLMLDLDEDEDVCPPSLSPVLFLLVLAGVVVVFGRLGVVLVGVVLVLVGAVLVGDVVLGVVVLGVVMVGVVAVGVVVVGVVVVGGGPPG